MKRNDWQKQFGAKRRAIDKAILEECERMIAAESDSTRSTRPIETPGRSGVPTQISGVRSRLDPTDPTRPTPTFEVGARPDSTDRPDPGRGALGASRPSFGPPTPSRPDSAASEARNAIARAFGRSIH